MLKQVYLTIYLLGEQHISEPKHRHGDQHRARSDDDSKGKSGKKVF